MNIPVERPTPELTRAAREAAQAKADELGVSLDRLCVVATPAGVHEVILLDEDEGLDKADEEC